MTDRQHARRISRICDELFTACKAATAAGLEVFLDLQSFETDDAGAVSAVCPMVSRTYEDE